MLSRPIGREKVGKALVWVPFGRVGQARFMKPCRPSPRPSPLAARFVVAGMVTALGSDAVTGCVSSPYDARWVEDELGRKVGHAVAHREAPKPTVGAKEAAASETTSLPRGVSDLTSLDEGQAVAVALWNSASFRADLAQLGFSRADLADAAALPNPSLAFLFPVGTRQMELSATYPVSSLVQRPWRVAAAKLDVERVARSLLQTGLDFVRDVRISWAETTFGEERLRARRELRTLAEKGAGIAAARLAAGDVGKLEAELVRADALVAADAEGRAEHEAYLARVRLRGLLGLSETPLGESASVKSPEPPSRWPPRALGELERVALAARPDVRALELGIEAAGEREGLEKAKIVQLLARLDGKPSGSGGGAPILFPPGGQAEIPIFNLNPGGRGRASAELERASWLYVAARQQVLTDVRIAREELVTALDSLAPYADTLVPLQERNVAAALRSYENGAEPYLVVLEAMRRLAEVRLRAIELALDVRRARARLDRATGWRIDASR